MRKEHRKINRKTIRMKMRFKKVSCGFVKKKIHYNKITKKVLKQIPLVTE